MSAPTPENEQHDEIWQLLDQAPQAEVEPFFAQRVRRALAEQGNAQPVSWLKRIGLWFAPESGRGLSLQGGMAVAGGLAAVALLAVVLVRGGSESAGTGAITQAPTVSEDVKFEAAPALEEITEVAAIIDEELGDMDGLLELAAVADVSTLRDDEIAMLLF